MKPGRKLYMDAMMIAKDREDLYFNSLALVNYIREEILLGEKDVSDIIPNLEKIEKHFDGKDIARDAREIIELHKKSKITSPSALT